MGVVHLYAKLASHRRFEIYAVKETVYRDHYQGANF